MPEREAATDLFAGGGEMGARMQALDWSTTAVGPVATWPQSLKTAVRILLTSRYAMWAGWGPDLTFFCNDAYRPTLGVKHSWALGASARAIWAEIWADIGPRADTVLRTGQATWDEGLLLFLERSGFPEETYHTFSYSPLPDDAGRVGGMLCVVTEDTERTLSERRMALLRGLAADLATTHSEEEVFAKLAGQVAAHPQDLPFVLTWLNDPATGTARLASGTDLLPAVAPVVLDLQADHSPWPVAEVLRRGETLLVDLSDDQRRALPLGCWDRPSRQAVLVPIAQQGQDRPAGVLVAGINPYRPFDAAYAGFVDLFAGQVASGLANARAHEDERRRAQALAELDRAKTAFFSNVSHEFRTPLTLLLGPIQDALEDTGVPLPDAHRERLQTAHRNALRLLKLVNTLLDFARIEAGRVEAVYEPTDLAALTRELASNFRSACERAGLALVVECPDLGEPVLVDRTMWEKIVLNLLSNAFKFTFAGEIVVGLARVGDQVELTVRDTGTGIPAEEMPHLFERFHRVRGARGRSLEGTGIGLALVQELVELHRGTVDAQSAVGVGTTFRVRVPLGTDHLPPERIQSERSLDPTDLGAAPYVLEALRWLPDDPEPPSPPLSPQPAEAPVGERRSTPGSRPGPLVLVADDNADMRDYLYRLLSTRYEVRTAADGEAALAATRDRLPDLLLSDVMMPRLDGFGLLRSLREDARTRAVPVILLSARAGEEARVEGLAHGPDDYLVKPFSARELLARIAAILELARVRREADEAVRAREGHLRTALQAARMVAWEWDLVTQKIRFSGDAVAMFFGEEEPVWSTETGWDRVHPDDRPELEALVRAAIARGERYTRQARFRDTAGAYHWMEIHGRVWCDDHGRPLRVSGVMADIGERKRNEEALRRYAGQLQRLASVASGIALARDTDAVLRVVAEEARLLIGVRTAVVRLTATPRQQGRAVRSSAGAHQEDGVPATKEMPATKGDDLVTMGDAEAIVCCTNQPLRLTAAECQAHFPADRTPNGFLAAPLVANDGPSTEPCRSAPGLIALTDKEDGGFSADDEAILVQLAQMASVALENARLYQALRDDDRRKDEFLATLAHELRNPLAPLRNALHILRLGEAAPGAPASALAAGRVREMMERQVDHMVRLVDDLLEISRITRGRIELRPERVEVASVVRTAVDTSRPLLDAAGHHLTMELPERPLFVEADPVRLAQVVANLLNNAAKYTPPRGHIHLSVRIGPGQWTLSVRDDGVGIPRDMLPRVFELFTQVDRTRKHAQGGLGIGLALVRSLVEMHGGAVEAFSDGPDRGSEFVVRLPLPAASVRPASEPTASAADDLRAQRILLVDDHRDAAESLGLLLRLLECDVRTTHNGPAALEALPVYRPTVVLLDIGMPGMDGYEVARRIRAQPEFRDLVLIALTGWGQEEDRRRARQAGFDHHLVKPVELETLRALLAASVRRSR